MSEGPQDHSPAQRAGNRQRGHIDGNPHQLTVQFIAVVATYAFVGAATWAILRVLDATVGLRMPEHEEYAGMDQALHGEEAYTL